MLTFLYSLRRCRGGKGSTSTSYGMPNSSSAHSGRSERVSTQCQTFTPLELVPSHELEPGQGALVAVRQRALRESRLDAEGHLLHRRPHEVQRDAVDAF